MHAFPGKWIAIAAIAGLALTGGRDRRGAGKLVGGFSNVYSITSYLSDILSYARILALGLATAGYFAVVRPLSPPSFEIMLKTELKRLPILEKLGVATTISLPDPDKRTDEVFESDLLADLDGEGSKSPPPSEMPEESGREDERPELPPSPLPADAIRYFA